MALDALQEFQLVEIADYLDELTPKRPRSVEEEYWRRLIAEGAKERDKATQEAFKFTNSEVEGFAMALYRDESPGFVLLKRLRSRKLAIDVFVRLLRKIRCQGAINVIEPAVRPMITRQPAPLQIRKGEQVILTCEAQCERYTPKYLWFHFVDDVRYPLHNEQSNRLVIPNASRKHSGSYSCRATNPGINDPKKSSSFTEWVDVDVFDPTPINPRTIYRQETQGSQPVPSPVITRQPLSVRKSAGDRTVLDCTAKGPGLVYAWFQNGRQIGREAAVGKLDLGDVIPSQAGQYHCEVINEGGKVDSARVEVDIAPAIEISDEPKDCAVFAGGEIYLRCKAYSPSHKEVAFQWYKHLSGEKFEVGTGPEFREKTTNDARHQQFKMHCRISLTQNPSISVVSKVVSVSIDTIRITKQPIPVEWCIGSKVSLVCEAKSLPNRGDMVYNWLKSTTEDGRQRSFITSQPPRVTLKDGVLSFDPISQKDWGYYMCQPANDEHFINSCSVKVIAVPPPGQTQETRKPPVIRLTEQPWSLAILHDDKCRLLCNAMATGDNPVHYQWYFGGIKLEGETSKELWRYHMRKKDFGVYFCEVRTNSGLAKTMSHDACIEELHKDHNSQATHETPLGLEQLRQIEAEKRFRMADERRFAREKVALLIGNQGYEHTDIGKLSTPENDVYKLRRKLLQFNFKVLSFTNLRFGEMMNALEHFYAMLSMSGVYALFYYAGHGFIHNGVTYLMPVDAQQPLECDFNIATDKIKYEMQDKLSRAFMILDCCRVTREGENVKPPSSHCTYYSVNSYLYEITSCAPAQAAYEDKQRPTSPFNTALLNALEEKKTMDEVFESIMEDIKKQVLSMKGKPFQRPTRNGSLADRDITLHDPVMLDDEGLKKDMVKIFQKWEQAHALPEPFELAGEMLGELRGFLSLKFSFSSASSNVLRVTISPQSLRSDGSKVVLSVDKEFLERQNVVGEWIEEKTEPGASPDAGNNPVDFLLQISHIQRLKEHLKLLLIVTMTTQKDTIDHSIPYTFRESILFSRLQ